MAEKPQYDFSFLRPTHEMIELPSRGYFYKGIKILEDAVLNVRPMTSVEEKLVDKITPTNFYSTIDEILSNCIKEDIDVNDLTPGDRIFTLLKIRGISYGSEYEVNFTCRSCEAELPIKINFADFDPVYLDEEVEEPIMLELPYSKAVLEMVIPRSGHIREGNARSLAEQKKSGVVIDPSIYHKALCCLSFTFPESSRDAGAVIRNDDPKGFKYILGIMSRLHVLDSQAIEDFFNEYDHGMINPTTMSCPVCEETFEQYIMLNWNFFRPRTKRKNDTDVQQFLFDVPSGESDRNDRSGARRSGSLWKVQLGGHSASDVRTKEKIPEENRDEEQENSK